MLQDAFNVISILALLVVFTAFASKYVKSDLLKFIILCANTILAVSILHPRFPELPEVNFLVPAIRPEPNGMMLSLIIIILAMMLPGFLRRVAIALGVAGLFSSLFGFSSILFTFLIAIPLILTILIITIVVIVYLLSRRR